MKHKQQCYQIASKEDIVISEDKVLQVGDKIYYFKTWKDMHMWLRGWLTGRYLRNE